MAKVGQHAKSLRLQAERRLGEILRDMPKATGAKGNPGGQGAQVVRFQDGTTQTPTLADIGIDKKTSMRAQRLAALPDDARHHGHDGPALDSQNFGDIYKLTIFFGYWLHVWI